jgi:lipase maturation factor 1
MPARSASVTAPDRRALLIYDGDCRFCDYWVRYWQLLTGEQISYQPFQQVAAQHPQIAPADFEHAIQYLGADGQRAAGAEASFLILSHAPGKGIWLWLYRTLPGFAPFSEWAYRIAAAHRGGAYRISLWLWGRNHRPPQYTLTAFLFLRLFGLIYLCAFVSFAVQAQGLIGSHGILPVADLVSTLNHSAGAERFRQLPMVFWLNSSDRALDAVCWGGAVLALLLVCNVLPRLCLPLLFLLYLSLLNAGQEFMTYQWDVFLLEAGFLALVMTFARTTGVWLLRWLLFRFLFMSGMVKLLSGDANWWNLSALSYHFVTQPLPTPLAWYAAQLPAALLRVATGCMLAIELLLPLLIFAPRRLRFAAAWGILLLQTCILLTGNYNWFNLQTMLLCLLLFDDAALRRILPARLGRWPGSDAPRTQSRAGRVALGVLAMLLVVCSLTQMAERFGTQPPAAAERLLAWVEPLHVVSGYGLFAVMTTERDEIVIEGSSDGISWSAYEFRYKPGDLGRRPPWNIPHQPRLDWQMWFAALEDPRRLRWFWRFLQKILENDPVVMGLLQSNPFPHQPPTYVRALFYAYTYSQPQQKTQGRWWQRRLLGSYTPVVQLQRADTTQ